MSRFVALSLPPQTVGSVARRAQAAQALTAQPARWVRPERYHLTVAFLQKDADLARVAEAVCALGVHAWGLALTLRGAGLFETRRAAAVLWLGVHDEGGALGTLRHAAATALDAWMAPDTHSREAVAHVTLARSQRADAFHMALPALEAATPERFSPPSLVLIDTVGDSYRIALEAPLM